MLSRANALSAILERMIVLYDRCLEIMTRERDDLVSVDFEALLNTLREKDEILEAIRALDRDRLRIQDEFAMVMEKKSSELTLKILGEALVSQGEDAARAGQRLLTLRRQLAAQIEELSHRVVQNRSFVEKSMENIREVAAIVGQAVSGRANPQKSAQKSSVYTKKAQVSPAGAPDKGSLVERRF
jgi:flagellar biosynthesis/type III secretory pathway chaperone